MKEHALALDKVGLILPWRIRLRLGGLREKKRILSNITFAVAPGEVVALMGRNGCGKSTLLRVISGIYAPTEGSLSVGGGGRVSVMALSMGFMPPLTGRENVALQGLIAGMHRSEARRAADEALLQMGDSEIGRAGRYDMPYHTYSAGMKATIASASALLKPADVILVDEVFGVGDGAFRAKLASRLRQEADRGAAVVVVSHDPEISETLCERAMLMEDGEMISASLPVSEARRHLRRQ